MKILAVSKYPPIQGGTASRCYFHYRLLAEAGHRVTVVTNAADVEPEYRCRLIAGDAERLGGSFPSGGEVRVLFADAAAVSGQFVPAGDATVTRLASLALQAREQFEPEVIFTSYLEPYGTAAALVAGWTGLPYVVEHAGSDRTRLLANPELGPALARVLRGAAVCFSGDRSLVGFGVAPDRIMGVLPSYLPADLFTPVGEDLSHLDLCSLGGGDRPAPPEAPVVGVYGKVGRTKGSFDLLAALDQLSRDGLGFQLAAMVGGRGLPAFERELAVYGLDPATTLLPFLCPWRVPAFLRSCAIVCFLERDFPVRIHGPKVAREVLATGRCLVLSEEIRRKQRRPERFVDGHNVVIVQDPRDTLELTGALRRVVSDPRWTVSVGQSGHDLFEPADPDVLVEGYEAGFDRAVRAKGKAARRRHSTEAEAVPGEDYPAAYAVLTAAKVDIALAGPGSGGDGLDVALSHAADSLSPDAPAWWADVLRYDAARAWLRHAPSWPAPETDGSRAAWASPRRDAAWRDLCPRLVAPVKTVVFGIRVQEAESALRAGDPPGALRPASETTTLLFVKSADLLGRAYEVSPSVASLLPLLDGSRSIRQICETAPVDPDNLAELLSALESDNAVRLSPFPSPGPAFAGMAPV
ncbi:MAG: hypothetical protein ACRDZ7_10440 [Acidimicrobiia bacterium]